jgi:TRAP-type C4-dicarboxylate transport system permease large subunit
MEDFIESVWPFLLAEPVVLFLMVLSPAFGTWPAQLFAR